MIAISWGLIVIGGFFYGVGGLGVFRMPDVYNRAQAGTKATTLGTLLTLLGMMGLHPQWWPKLLIIMIFIAITNPIGSSTLVRNAFIKGVKPIDGTSVEPFDFSTKKEGDQ